MNINEFLDRLDLMFPNAHCELEHDSPFQLMVAVVLSAQTTDIRVNIVTKDLFSLYPTAELMATASVSDIERLIRSIGLYKNKAKHLVALATRLVKVYASVVPETMKDLTSLDGVGRKSANVILSVCFGVPAIAVDTHVERVSKRLRLVPMTKNVLDTEKTLMRKIPKEQWSQAHHLFIFFGRYFCKAKRPLCEQCPFQITCRVYEKNQNT